MTRVSYIHATPQRIPDSEWADRAAEYKAPTLMVPFNELTEGETMVWLALQRARMFAAYYQENRQEYTQAANDLQKILATGLHTGGDQIAYSLPSSLKNWLGNIVQRAKARVNPTMGRFSTRLNAGQKIGNIIPLPDCFDSSLGFYAKVECIENYEWLAALNENLVKVSHHFLYQWRKSEHTAGLRPESAAVIAAKGVLHSTAVTAMANIAEFEREIMVAYMETGIMERNIGAGLPPLDGSQSIFQLREGAGIDIASYMSGNKIGNPAAVLAIIKVVVEAISAIAVLVGVIKSLRKVDIKQGQLRSLGSLEFSPNGTDFDQAPPGILDDNNNILLMLAVGGAMIFFGSQDEK